MNSRDWAAQIWRDPNLYVTMAATRHSRDEWDLVVKTMSRGRALASVASLPQERTWYCKYAMLERPLANDEHPRKEHIAGGYVLWADVDLYKGQEIPKTPLEPTFTIQTSPNGYHMGWILKHFATARELQGHNKVLQRTWTKSDPVHDPGRWMKPPWGYNYKELHGGAFPTRLIQSSTTWYDLKEFGITPEYEKTYDLGDWDMGAAIDAEEIDDRYNVKVGTLLHRRLHEEAQDGRRHQEIYYMVSQLCRRGATLQEVYWRLLVTPTVQSKFWHGEGANLVRDPDHAYLSDIRTTYARLSAEYDALSEGSITVRGSKITVGA
jgi:hypothetical protein